MLTIMKVINLIGFARYMYFGLSFIILLFNLSACSVSIPENDLEKENLKGKVKSVKSEYYYATEKFGEAVKVGKVKPKILYGHAFYNSYQEKYEIFDRNGFLSEKYSYDTLGKIKSRMIVKRTDHPKVYENFTYSYDEGVESLSTVGTSVYDALNNTQIETSIIFGDTIWVDIYKFDKGRKIEHNNYSKDGSRNWKSTYEYKNSGRLIVENSHDEFEDIRIKTSLDKSGNPILIESSDFFGEFKTKKKYEYNEYGDVISFKSYNKNGHVESHDTFSYVYDNVGNWIQKTENNDGKPVYITERKIEYYE